jgi:hemoglobin
MPGSVLERYGGFAFLSRVVMAFYDKVLDSDTLAPYFEDVDMRRLVDHQTKFISFLLGGPGGYTNDHLGRVHARLHIDRETFDVMMATLRDTLEEFEMEDADISLVAREFRARAPWIISEPAAESSAAKG